MDDYMKPRPYDLTNQTEVKRLMQEAQGYLSVCIKEHHGTDREGRAFAHAALKEAATAIEALTLANKALRELLGKAVMALTEAQPHLPSGTDAEEFCSTMIGEIAQALSAGLTKGEK